MSKSPNYAQLSRGARKIRDILENSNLTYQTEFTPSKLSSFKNKPLRFDFAIIHNGQLIFIEYDGEQHFKYVPYFHKTKQQFSNAKGRDRHKNNYALAHKIPLYRIPYFEIENIKQFKDIIQDKFLVKTKWHCDEVARNIPK